MDMHDEITIERARARARAHPNDLEARFAFARMLVHWGAFDEATTELVELWPRMRGAPHVYPPINDLAQLIATHAPAREIFVRLRDACEVGSEDWLDLAFAVGDDAVVLAWFDAARDQLNDDEDLASRVERHAIPLLCDAERWADAGHAYVRPRPTLARILEEHAQKRARVGNKNDETSKTMLELADSLALYELSTLRRALHAAHRDDEVRALDDAVEAVNVAWLQSVRAGK